MRSSIALAIFKAVRSASGHEVPHMPCKVPEIVKHVLRGITVAAVRVEFSGLQFEKPQAISLPHASTKCYGGSCSEEIIRSQKLSLARGGGVGELRRCVGDAVIN